MSEEKMESKIVRNRIRDLATEYTHAYLFSDCMSKSEFAAHIATLKVVYQQLDLNRKKPVIEVVNEGADEQV